MNVTFTLNTESQTVDVEKGTPLLWVLRERLGLTGTKFGCGLGQCGACSVLMGKQRVFSCLLPIEAAAGRTLTTIEGLSENNDHPLQQAWVEERVPQCGYCQSGMIMNAAALLEANPKPTDEQIVTHMNNLCRCGTYPRIKRAIKRASAELSG